MKKLIKRMLVFVLLCFVYCWIITPPTYEGKLTIDLNNTTLETLHGITLEYESANKEVEIVDIRPLERVIVIPPNDVCEKPMKTRIFIKYNDMRKEIIGEYYSIFDDLHNQDVKQYAKAKIYENRIAVPLYGSIFLKPYIRIIDMN